MAGQDDIEVWPDNWLPVQAFIWLDTQWNVGYGGPIGLRYEVFPEARRRFAISDEAWPDVADCVQIMENKAIRIMKARAAKER